MCVYVCVCVCGGSGGGGVNTCRTRRSNVWDRPPPVATQLPFINTFPELPIALFLQLHLCFSYNSTLSNSLHLCSVLPFFCHLILLLLHHHHHSTRLLLCQSVHLTSALGKARQTITHHGHWTEFPKDFGGGLIFCIFLYVSILLPTFFPICLTFFRGPVMSDKRSLEHCSCSSTRAVIHGTHAWLPLQWSKVGGG